MLLHLSILSFILHLMHQFFTPWHPSFLRTDGESKAKAKKDTNKAKAKKKKRKGNDHEALEDSDDGDYEGVEVDYMSDESRSESLPVAFEDFLIDTIIYFSSFAII